MAAARTGRNAGSAPGPSGGSRQPARGPGMPVRGPVSSAASRSPARRPVISASVSELDASRLAPCTPVDAASPTAYSPGTVVRPSMSARMPPQA